MFIIDHCCISPQKSFNDILSNHPIKQCIEKKYLAVEPSYKNLIPNNLLRRMEKDMRIGVGAGMSLIQNHPNLGGVILGTATAGLSGGMNFLKQIMDYKEKTLSPTNFIQSTPNAIAGTIARMSQNKNYNNTYTGEGTAFETVLLDAITLVENESRPILIGSVDTLSNYNYNIQKLAGCYKEESVVNSDILKTNTKGHVPGEGAAMFIVSKNKEKAKCKIIDVNQFFCRNQKNINEKSIHFINKNNFNPNDIDTLILGFNGDVRYDSWYNNLMKAYPRSNIYTYKNIVGEYPSSSSFATWMASSILEGKKMPTETIYRNNNNIAKNILIYNNYLGEQHSLILITGI